MYNMKDYIKDKYFNKESYNIENERKEEKRMSYMIAMTNYEQTVIVTDSRETMSNGTYNDCRQKIFVSENKDIAVGVIGPIKRKMGETVYNIPKIIAEEIFKGSELQNVLFKKIGDFTLKDIVALNGVNDVLTIFVARKGSKLQGIDYIAKNNSIKLLDYSHCYFSGDFTSDLVSKMLKLDSPAIMLDIEYLKNKSVKAMKRIIELSEEFAGYEDKTSTIGGEIQCVVI